MQYWQDLHKLGLKNNFSHLREKNFKNENCRVKTDHFLQLQDYNIFKFHKVETHKVIDILITVVHIQILSRGLMVMVRID